ncbi:hypothetical protein M422DRAFT_50110 [Sphaerobolus stellatus SS14]|uniref:Uncharacterized protein n=1 Tax=Sphaerobolus stellatus (strain SS14) TaxID=990650 RepID=A0A0C9VKF5_SPHS4|nr:hypothetical protein M422DRAFT_50110 [Sphaerobolus stellatus SS14]
MGTCSGCNTSYPALDSDSCGQCTKLQGKTETERRVIKSHPQCHGCSIVYLNLLGPLCGRCIGSGVKVDDTYEEFDNSAIEDLTPEPETVVIIILILFCSSRAFYHCFKPYAMC